MFMPVHSFIVIGAVRTFSVLIRLTTQIPTP